MSLKRKLGAVGNMIGNGSQPNACYIPARATSPLVGPGSLSPRRPQEKKDVGVLQFSSVPRFASPSPGRNRPPVGPVYSFSTDSAGRPVHFSRRRSQTGSRASVRSPSPSRKSNGPSRKGNSASKRNPPRYHPAPDSRSRSSEHTMVLGDGVQLQYLGGVTDVPSDTSSVRS